MGFIPYLGNVFFPSLHDFSKPQFPPTILIREKQVIAMNKMLYLIFYWNVVCHLILMTEIYIYMLTWPTIWNVSLISLVYPSGEEAT